MSQTLASFWRTVRHKGIWLNPKHLMRWHTSNKLHAHTADACVQAFFAGLNERMSGLCASVACSSAGTRNRTTSSASCISRVG